MVDWECIVCASDMDCVESTVGVLSVRVVVVGMVVEMVVETLVVSLFVNTIIGLSVVMSSIVGGSVLGIKLGSTSTEIIGTICLLR